VRVSIFTSLQTVIDTTFVSAAARYWIGVYPFVCREIHHWERRARTIPDPNLRRLALKALRDERGNLEGAAAYAAFTTPLHRTGVARAAIAFQAAYDYADAISEQPDIGHTGNIIRLHRALQIALEPGVAHLNYYPRHGRSDDGGYLNSLVDRCRAAILLLPSFPVVARHARRAAARIVTYQCLNHPGPGGSHHAFARWASKQTTPGTDLRWWEAGAAAGSSLAVFALMSAAAHPTLPARHAAALESAYFPWIGALHTLLDSLIDEPEDRLTDQHSLTARYTSHEETAGRLQTLATRATHHARALPDAERHMMILASMVSFYLAHPQAKAPHANLAAESVLAMLEDYAIPAMLVLRARHAASHLARRVIKFSLTSQN
jgi:tetraprenyl-beta-curcumene synthase